MIDVPKFRTGKLDVDTPIKVSIASKLLGYQPEVSSKPTRNCLRGLRN